jgi:hypothetical protein
VSACIAPSCDRPAELGAVFCAKHLVAPAGKRGGWLSAFKRAQKRGSGTVLDASAVARRLWIGGVPPFDRDLPFQVLVLCALEHQPEALAFRGQVLRAPITDGPLSPRETQWALDAARGVAQSLAAGKNVLVTCHAGRNRSALVAGLGLGMVTRMKPEQIVTLVRTKRSLLAFSNPHFVRLLGLYVPRRPSCA